MTKIIEIKKSDFFKKIKAYAVRKKETPLKLYTTPQTLEAVKIRFMFSKVNEMVFQPQDLPFYQDASGKKSKAKVTDNDSARTYYFGFCGPALRELTVRKIYTGKNAAEKLEALSAWLSALKDDKIIVEIVFEDAVADTADQEDMRSSQSYVESFGSQDDASKSREGGKASPSFLGEMFDQNRKKCEEQEAIINWLEGKVESCKKLADGYAEEIRKRDLKIASLKEEKGRKASLLEQAARDWKGLFKESQGKIDILEQTVRDLKLENAQLRLGAADRPGLKQADKGEAGQKGIQVDSILSIRSDGRPSGSGIITINGEETISISWYRVSIGADGRPIRTSKDGAIRINRNRMEIIKCDNLWITEDWLGCDLHLMLERSLPKILAPEHAPAIIKLNNGQYDLVVSDGAGIKRIKLPKGMKTGSFAGIFQENAAEGKVFMRWDEPIMQDMTSMAGHTHHTGRDWPGRKSRDGVISLSSGFLHIVPGDIRRSDIPCDPSWLRDNGITFNRSLTIDGRQ